MLYHEHDDDELDEIDEVLCLDVNVDEDDDHEFNYELVVIMYIIELDDDEVAILENEIQQ